MKRTPKKTVASAGGSFGMGGISTVGRGEGALCGRRWSAQHPSDHPAASVERFLPRFFFFFFFF